jgi:hypothetical protein
MSSELARIMIRFLDLTAHGDVWAEHAVDYGFETVIADGDGSFDQERRLIEAADEDAQQIIRHKVFPNAKPAEFNGPKIRADLWDVDADLIAASNSKIIASVLKDLVAWCAEAEGISREEMVLRIEAHGTTIDELHSALLAQREARHHSSLRAPSVERALLRRYLNKLEQIANRVEGLEALPINWELVPDHLKVLIANAHEAALLGQDVACAILCGAAIEEALKLTVGEVNYQSFIGALRLATEKGFFTDGSVEVKAAEHVKEMRNRAVHNPKKFFLPYTKPRPDVLVETRIVLAHLFSGAV